MPVSSASAEGESACQVPLLVLGIAQDAGRPQMAQPADPAWRNASLRRLATSLALVDRRTEPVRRWLFEATPDIKYQLQRLDQRFPVERYVGLDGIFVTHAHIGHYTGLMHFGREAARTDGLPVYAMPLMKRFLETNGPWDQLVRLGNISTVELADGRAVVLADAIRVSPLGVPHRREYSETVGFRIEGPSKSALFIPDIDRWDELSEQGRDIEDLVRGVDHAFVDATFYGNEMPNVSEFPHPKILESMDRFDSLADRDKAKVRFIHLNHSNPALLPGSAERRHIVERGFHIAEELEVYCL